LKAEASWLSGALSKHESPTNPQSASVAGRAEADFQPQESPAATSLRALGRHERQRLASESATATYISKTQERTSVVTPWGWRVTPMEATRTTSMRPLTPTVVMLAEQDPGAIRFSKPIVRRGGVTVAVTRGRDEREGGREGEGQHCDDDPAAARWKSPFEMLSQDAKDRRNVPPPLSPHELQQCLRTVAPSRLALSSSLLRAPSSSFLAPSSCLLGGGRGERGKGEGGGGCTPTDDARNDPHNPEDGVYDYTRLEFVGTSGVARSRSSSPLPPKPLALSLSPGSSSPLESLGEPDAFVRKGGGGGGVGEGEVGRRGGGGDGEGGAQRNGKGGGGRKIESAIGAEEANVNVGTDGGQRIMGGRDGGGYIHNMLMTVDIIDISDSAGMSAGRERPEVEREGERGETEGEHESVQTVASVLSPWLSSGEKVSGREGGSGAWEGGVL